MPAPKRLDGCVRKLVESERGRLKPKRLCRKKKDGHWERLAEKNEFRRNACGAELQSTSGSRALNKAKLTRKAEEASKRPKKSACCRSRSEANRAKKRAKKPNAAAAAAQRSRGRNVSFAEKLEQAKRRIVSKVRERELPVCARD